MTRVLLVGKGPPDRGGIAAFLHDLMASDLAKAHDLRFLNVAHDGIKQGGRLSGGNLRRAAADAAAVWRQSGDRDIVHIHSALAPAVTLLRAGLLAAAARVRGSRALVHAHGGQVQLWLVSARRRRFARLALLAASRVVTVSEGGTTALQAALGPERVRQIDNGVDVDMFRPGSGPHDQSRILYVGLLTPRKGLLDLFAAVECLRERGLQAELLVVGGAPDEGPEAESAVKAAADGHVRFLGVHERADMPGFYQAADIFCLPSWWEAMPLSVLEAMAAGLPVVATDVGDVRRLVEHGVTGYVVRPHDRDSLVNALAELVADPTGAAAMGAAGRERARRCFASSVTVRHLSALYEETAARSGVR